MHASPDDHSPTPAERVVAAIDFDETAERMETRTDVVRRALTRAIVEGRLHPGERLTEGSIGLALGVSRTIVREAFGRMVVQGLVELRRNRGAFVAKPNFDDGQQVFIVRRGLERLVAETLAGHLRPADLEQLRTHLRRETAPGEDGPYRGSPFHLLLARLTGNHVLIDYVTEVLPRCTLAVSALAGHCGCECDARDHPAIVDALSTGDAPEACRRMDRHLDATLDRARPGPRAAALGEEEPAPHSPALAETA